MGITNFTKLIAFLDEEEQWNEPFDSILIDAQSLLYTAIDQCFPYDENIQNDATHESRFIRDISSHVQKKMAEIITSVFQNLSSNAEKEMVIVCSFDGRGVPMKWPTQSKRRRCATATENKNSGGKLTGKNVYRVSLFGNNLISTCVRNDLLNALKSGRFHERFRHRRSFPEYMRYIVSGCDVDGEGEHKIFHIAEALGVTSPVIVSVDNDAFLLAFLRIDRFQCLQLYRHSNKQIVYNLTHFAREILKIPVRMLVYVSFLFGNDFIPPLLTLTDSNARPAADALVQTWENFEEFGHSTTKRKVVDDYYDTPLLVQNMPVFFAMFLHAMKPHMRFEKEINRSPEISEKLAIYFWTVCLWTLDYYTRRDFPQKLAANLLWDSFDRNTLLAVLLDQDESCEMFNKALDAYHSDSITKEVVVEEGSDELAEARKVFDSATLEMVSRFLQRRKNGKREGKEEDNEGFSHDIKISTSKRKKTITNELGKIPEKKRIESPRK